ncbi:zinc-dependent alcohol dehydrogenase family protein [Acidocella aromatica]|uniref:NADPH:quinone reductase-like Zn-dependent oxidoreductase n=1 Tax=Acidocella aromatica TaxID=1303579 RepID=A0A840VQH6_9PROT|nr:NAD(P)-dependent alcohol dehydrogenase [Acidocella aromatica]MBB5372552.1 NADPH:quinone reductase-like Zn-dependent oxidoreductase [Acidocella aromatica]
MKAIKIKQPAGLENLLLTEMDAPSPPGPGEILVRLHASSLNYHDYAVAIGAIATAEGRIPMADGAGVVQAVGAGVGEFKPGDHVVSCFFPHWLDGAPRIGDFSTTPGDGVDGYAREYVTVPAQFFTHAPRGWTHAEAATLTTAGLTAWRALVVEGRIKPGETVLVLGSGGVSVFALQIARAAGANVIATSSSDEKLERLRALGAEYGINYRTTPEWGRAVLDYTGGRGVDHVVEVGGPGTLAQSITAVRIGGHISLIGVLTGWGGEVPTAALMLKQARLQGIVVGNRRQQVEMVAGMEASGIRPVIDSLFALEDIANAFQHEKSGRHFGKICLEF